jgi:uncharacterized repeat protein (TIGR03809 family)
MTHRSDVARGREIIARWCKLAEQRLDYLTDLFETGRWRRFHSEAEFLENIVEAKAAVETWRSLLTREGSTDNSAVDMSWLERRKAIPPRTQTILREEFRRPLPRFLQVAADRMAPAPVESPSESPPPDSSGVFMVRETPADPPSESMPPDRVEPASTAPDNAWRQALDLSAMQQRYPLLRNTL